MTFRTIYSPFGHPANEYTHFSFLLSDIFDQCRSRYHTIIECDGIGHYYSSKETYFCSKFQLPMISYNPKEWFSFIFRFHKADTFRKLLPLMGALAIYSGFVAYLELEYWKLAKDSVVRNITITHSMLGFVISLLLVFRTNTAYDRWWEGRKLWGALVNNSRNLALKLNALLQDPEERAYFRVLIPTYAHVLAAHLQREKTALVLFEDVALDHDKHVPNQVAGLMINRITQLQRNGNINGYELLHINAELQSFTDICGACERIKNTPIPYSYSAFIKKFIFFYVMSLPFGYVFDLGYYVIPVVVFILYVLASLELIAEEIEDPFGTDVNDLPMARIASQITEHVEHILADKEQQDTPAE